MEISMVLAHLVLSVQILNQAQNTSSGTLPQHSPDLAIKDFL
jgi:hypothetical protein